MVAHRRYGKDEIALQALAAKAMSRVGSYWHCLPAYEQARKAIWEMVNWRTGRTRIDDAFPPEIVTRRDNQSMMLWLESGSTVQLVGSDNVDSLVGGGQIGITMSEAALSNPKAKQFFQPILEESGGWLLEISSPRGKNHFYRAYLGAKEYQDAGDTSVLASFAPATQTKVFSAEQLARIRTELIQEHGNTIGSAVYAQEYECSFEAAIAGAVWGAEIEELEAEGRVKPCAHDKRLPVRTSWDLGVSDATVILFWQTVGSEYRLIDAYEGTGIGLETYVDILKQKHYEKGYSYATHFAPHDISQREWGRGISRIDQAKRLGLVFTPTLNTRIPTQISLASQIIRQMVVNESSEGAMQAFDRFKAYKYPADKATGAFGKTPVHDDASHASSALCTFGINIAKELGLQAYRDEALHSEVVTQGNRKFDPRQYGPAPYSGVTNKPSRSAF
jgi:phage terminase large subunit